jgi:hypothetical protein
VVQLWHLLSCYLGSDLTPHTGHSHYPGLHSVQIFLFIQPLEQEVVLECTKTDDTVSVPHLAKLLEGSLAQRWNLKPWLLWTDKCQQHELDSFCISMTSLVLIK